MGPGLKLESAYENHLDIDRFERMFNNKTQSYKFYWFEAILNLMKDTEEDLTFDAIIDEMICDAWYTVTHYHLKLGPTVNGSAENFLEHAINTLNSCVPDLSQNPSNAEIKNAITKCQSSLRRDKMHLADYVPYKLLSPFFDAPDLKEGLDYIKTDKRNKLITYMMETQIRDRNILYLILDGDGLQKKIRIHPSWRQMILQNFYIIQSWVQYNKVQFLQDRNPGVPGIIYKVCPEVDDIRKLEQTRKLWKATVNITGNPIKEIYTGNEIDLDSLSIDHFIPRYYISNDELWNLIPMSRTLNSSKNNKLPSWDLFFEPFAQYQYYLYDLIFTGDASKNKTLIDCFEKCRKNNVNALWASETLYISGNSREQFLNILNHNLRPIYDAAQLQGYDIWRNNK